MTDNELDAILKEIERRANEKAPIDITSTTDEPKVKEAPATDVLEPAVEKTEESVVKENVFDTPVEKPVKNDNPLVITEDSNDNDFIDLSSFEQEYEERSAAPEEEEEEIDEVNDGKNKKIIIIIVAIVALIAIAVGVYFGFFHNKGEEPAPTQPATTKAAIVVDEDKGAMNPLTGEFGYNDAAVGKRPVAVVVENEYSTESVRPQWGLNKADILLEGESEFSTRLLLFFADYTNVPEKVGPARSARPPFIHFAQLFDAPFIHAGLSHSKGNYTGADSVFTNEGVDHYNLLSGSEGGRFFDRDKSRTSTIEHTGFLNGTNVKVLFEAKEWRTDIDEAKFSVLAFNEEAKELSQTPAEKLEFNWSDVYSSGKCPKTGHFSYDSEKKAYTTTDFDSRFGTADLEFANLVFLLDETEYVVKENYKGSGSSEVYCNYKLSGGKGVVASMGTKIDITWGVKNGKLWIKDADGNDIALNPGKTYIGYGSSNHGGAVKDATQSEKE